MNYYDLLEISSEATKEEIKKQYHSLSKKYHPDKNNGEDTQFKKIKEAFDVLYDDEERKKYDIQLLFGDIQFTEEDIILLDRYYNKLINSNEFKLMKLLYDSIPKNVKTDIWNKFKYRNTKIIKSHKSIDITGLINNDHINLVLSNYDYENNILKIIYIFSKSGNYYLYLRKPPNKLNLYNGNYIFTINFYILN